MYKWIIVFEDGSVHTVNANTPTGALYEVQGHGDLRDMISMTKVDPYA